MGGKAPKSTKRLKTVTFGSIALSGLFAPDSRNGLGIFVGRNSILMTKILSILLFFLISCNVGNNNHGHLNLGFRSDTLQVGDILKEGSSVVSYSAYEDLPEREKNEVKLVTRKIEIASKKDSTLMDRIMNDERIDYAGIGITKEQLVRVNQIMNQRRIVKLQDRLRIFKNEEFYCFDGAGRLAYLNSVRVRADGSFARINDIKMYPDSSSFRKPADSSYLYPRLRFTSYGHNQMLDMLYDGKFTLTIGKVQKTGKRYLEIWNNLIDPVDSSIKSRFGVELE